jgi:hypothetical protein
MIVTFKTSKSNPCPQDWFNTQALTIEDKHQQLFEICAKLKLERHI